MDQGRVARVGGEGENSAPSLDIIRLSKSCLFFLSHFVSFFLSLTFYDAFGCHIQTIAL